MKTIVVIEDEPDILEVLCYNLNREGYNVRSCMDGAEGLDTVIQTKPDLVLLDLMLPSMDGLEICRQLKNAKITSDIPIIIVSAKGEESDVVLGLGLGADDYVAKPFSPRELIARVKAVMRRTSSESYDEPERIEYYGLVIDLDKFKVTVDGNEIKLTATEFRLLHQFANHPGRVFTRDQLLDHAFRSDAVVVDRNIDVHIRAIRRKIGSKEFIETIRGVGYRLKEFDR